MVIVSSLTSSVSLFHRECLRNVQDVHLLCYLEYAENQDHLQLNVETSPLAIPPTPDSSFPFVLA